MTYCRSIPVAIACAICAAVFPPAALGQCGNVNSPYGINAHAPSGAALTQLLDKVQAAGLGWVRIDFNWFAIEGSQDVFNWSVYDAIATAANARGLRIFAGLGYTPPWATSGSPQTGAPNSAADWYDFCFRAAQRYPTIQHWGMWNEPDSTGFWTGTRQQYIDLILKNGADAIHAANPQAKVCGPELDHIGSHQWYNWLKDCISQSSGKLDIVTHHVYDSNYTDVRTKLEATTAFGTNPSLWGIINPSVKEVLVNSGWFGQPVWLTEVGWASDQVSEATQSTYYNSLLSDWFTGQANRSWISKVFFYELQDDPTTGVPKWGILRADYSNKPSYSTYQSFITAHPPTPVVPCKATTPAPSAGSTAVAISTTLAWAAGPGAATHNVYFGTVSPGTLRGNQAGTTYSPGLLNGNTTYFWRIDEVNIAGTTTGDVWSFTTGTAPIPGKATAPSPSHLATGSFNPVVLNWTAGSNCNSHNVYFGTVSPGTLRGSQPGTSFDPGPLAPLTTYYWRIDETGPGGTTMGDVWRFTMGGQAGDFDTDGDVDQTDFAFFQRCLSGSGVPYASSCSPADMTGNGDVDQTDLSLFLGCMAGPRQAPGC